MGLTYLIRDERHLKHATVGMGTMVAPSGSKRLDAMQKLSLERDKPQGLDARI